MPGSTELEGANRRNFFVGAIYGIWAVIAAALGLPALVYLFVPPKARKEEEWTPAGDVSRLAPDSPLQMVFRRNRVDGWKIASEMETAWVVKRAGNGVVAFGPQCTHLGCAYHWDERRSQFLCPCHNSLFSVDGTVLSGPAPRPLDKYETKIEGTQLLLGRLRRSTGHTS